MSPDRSVLGTPAAPRGAHAAAPAGASGGIALHGLTKSFSSSDGPIHAVRGIDVDISPGETVALLGPNGAGKSTTIDMLLGLARPDAGTVRVFGRTPEQAIAAGQVGAMLQTGGLMRFVSVRELLTLTAALYPKPLPIDEVLRITGAADFADQRTEGLSGGQTQRTRAALALVANPDLLVLDEPTVAMDVEGRRVFWGAVREFARAGKTVLFATHYLEEADQYADRVVLMAHGKIVADGAAGEIKALAGNRTIRATLPDVAEDALLGLPGVESVERHGESVTLSCSDADGALRAFLPAYTAARDIEVSGAGLEAAFLALTGDAADFGSDSAPEGGIQQ